MTDFLRLAEAMSKDEENKITHSAFVLGGLAAGLPLEAGADASTQQGYLIHSEEYDDPAEAHVVHEWRKDPYQVVVTTKTMDLLAWLNEICQFDDAAWSEQEVRILGSAVVIVMGVRASDG